MNERIKLDMSITDILVELSEGNPGALNVMLKLAEAAPQIDPSSAFAELTPLLYLDALNIYGSDIWVLFKDVCGHDVTKTLAILRANQLGLLDRAEIIAALTQGPSEGKDALIDQAQGIVALVQEKLPDFGKDPVTPV